MAQKQWEHKLVNLMEGLEEQVMELSFEQIGEMMGEEADEEKSSTNKLFTKIKEKLDKLGNDRWELAGFIQQIAVFKREKK